jgi:hypothetical protein
MLGKLPQPGVDIVNMAAPLLGRASTICTATLKSIFCRLLYLCGIVEIIQKAWNERNLQDKAYTSICKNIFWCIKKYLVYQNILASIYSVDILYIQDRYRLVI